MSGPRAGNRDRSPSGEASDRSPSSVELVRAMLPPGGGLWQAPGPIATNRDLAAVPPPAVPPVQPAVQAPRDRTVNRNGKTHELHRLSPEERARFRRHVSLVVFLSTGAILVIALYLLLRLG